MQVLHGSSEHLRGFNGMAQDGRGKVPGGEEKQERQGKHEITALDHCGCDAVVPALPVATRNDDLSPESESERQHEHGHVINPAEGAGPQGHVPHASQEDGVRQSDHVFNNQADHERIGHEPDFAVGDGGRIIHNKKACRYCCLPGQAQRVRHC